MSEHVPTFSTHAAECDAIPSGVFYLRECYVEVYNRIIFNFDSDEIWGTTVMGASARASQRLIVFISFDKDSVVKRAVVWKNGESTELDMTNIFNVELTFSDDLDAVFLLDGSPSRVLVLDHRHVVFTSPNERWVSKIETDDMHMTLYMPLWDVEELKTAVEALGLALVRMEELPEFSRSAQDHYKDEVAYRFDVFGGVARSCLETDAVVLASQLQELQLEAANVDVKTGMEVVNGQDSKQLRGWLYHWHPFHTGYIYDIKVASPYVTQLLSARVDGKDAGRLALSGNACSEAAALDRAMTRERLVDSELLRVYKRALVDFDFLGKKRWQ